MYQVLMALHVFITVGLIIVILIQRSDTDGLGGLGGGGNSMSGFMTGRAAANALTRITAIFATLFIVNSLALGIIVAHNRGQGSIAERIQHEQNTQAPAPAATPSVPKPDATAPAPLKQDAAPAEKPTAATPEKSAKTPSVPKPE